MVFFVVKFISIICIFFVCSKCVFCVMLLECFFWFKSLGVVVLFWVSGIYGYPFTSTKAKYMRAVFS